MTAVPALGPLLRWKHRIATSPLAGLVAVSRGGLGRLRALWQPELGLLHQESRYIDACLRRLIRPDWACMDVGAHVGSVSYLLSTLAPRGSLTIVEALPAQAAALRARFPQATVHQVAAGDRSGEVSFYENTTNPGFSSLSNRASRGTTREIRVTMARIDDLWPAGRVLHFLKVDAERHEAAVLRGAEQTLRRHQPAILFEAGAPEDPDAGPDGSDEMFGFLTGLGYRIRPVFHQYFGREPVGSDGFSASRRYPFTAFNFFATQG